MGTASFEDTLIVSIYDKLQHLAAFVCLGFLADNAFPKIEFLWKIAIVIFAYGVLLEITQSFLPHRTFALSDLFANAVGLFVYYILQKIVVLSLPIKSR